MRRRIRSSALALVTTLAFTLTSCADGGAPAPSPSATADTQSASAACALVRSSVADAAEKLHSLDASDPEAAAEAMGRVADGLGDVSAAIDNAEVAALLPALQTGFADAEEILQSIAAGDHSQLPALQQAAGGIKDSLEQFAQLCGTA